MTYLPEARRQLMAAAEQRAARRLAIPPPRLSWVVPAISLAVAGAVAIAFLSLRTANRTHSATPSGARQIQLIYRAQPTTQVPKVTHQALELTVRQINLRLSEIPHSFSSVRILAGDRIRVDVRTREGLGPVQARIGSDAQLLFYDWEINVLLPNGRSAASELSRGHRSALELSQGNGDTAIPGGPTAGARGLYQAVRLASKQPYAPSPDSSRDGSEYYLFAQDGRLVAGPLDPGNVSRRQGVRELEAGVSRTARHDGHVLVVKQGTVVVQAAPNNFRVAEPFGAPDAGYYVLHDHVALFGNQITNPRASTDSTGAPDVQFGFRAPGAAEFWRLTGAVARRGELDSIGSRQLFQHFAIALDNQLITVPQIDYTAYPDGLPGRQGADITGGFTRSAARGLVTALRLGTLPLKLTLVSARR